MDKAAYDIAIIGGGLAGLSLSLLMRKKGYTVILFEKEAYPFHKVCGEYISLESWDFLSSLGIPLTKMGLPLIKKLQVSSPDGTLLQTELDLGGFGISRYKLDHALKQLAEAAGVWIFENCKVEQATWTGDHFNIQTSIGNFIAAVCCGSYGKRSNLDVKWKRPFTQKNAGRLTNYIGIKYHIHTIHPQDTIALHNFDHGYCGISKIEDERYCLCYLTTADNLKRSGNSIAAMEKDILSQNPHLAKIFKESKPLYDAPLSISQVSFNKKSQVEDHIILLGDAAGMITPLCGNGMSMALRSANIASGCIHAFMQHDIGREAMEKKYARSWQKTFGKRLWFGRMIQSFFGKKRASDRFISLLKKFPSLTNWLIRQTHGKPF